MARVKWIVCVLVLLACPAMAGPGKQGAQRLFREGNELFQRGDYQGALQRFRQAKALYPSYKIDLNIGSTLNALGRLTEAAAYYDLFLRQAARRAPAEIITAARGSLDELQGKLAQVMLDCPGKAMVEVDGHEVGHTPLEQPIYLVPGRHRIVASVAGRPRLQQDRVFRAGERVQLSVPWEVDAGDPATGHAEANGHVHVRRSKTIWAYTSLGLGLACAVTASILFGVGLHQGDAAHEQYRLAEGNDINRYEQKLEDAETKLTAGHAVLWTGVAVLGFSVYQLLTRPATEQRPGRRAVWLEGVGVTGRF